MGTRSVSGVRYQGIDKLSYNHFDGHPECVGRNIVTELRDRFAGRDYDEVLAELREKAANLRLVDEQETPTDDEKQAALEAGLNERLTEECDWYVLLRNHHGSILQRLDYGTATENNDFIKDSLFCEWGYVLTLDNDPALEIYKGFQRSAHDKGRYAAKSPTSGGYYPCALIATIPLRDIAEKNVILVELPNIAQLAD